MKKLAIKEANIARVFARLRRDQLDISINCNNKLELKNTPLLISKLNRPCRTKKSISFRLPLAERRKVILEFQ